MRCKICDFSPDVPSMYHTSVVMPKRVKMCEDPETGEVTCNCFSQALDEEDEDYSQYGGTEVEE